MTTTPPPAKLSAGAVHPLRTLDPHAPWDDLAWLDEAVGDARVVAIGESAHYNREFIQLRHRLTRRLVERHGFSAYAMETGFVEGWLPDDWVRGGGHDLGDVLAKGLTSLMGLWAQTRAHLEWMRRHNGGAAHPIGFYGIDMPGSMVSLLPGLEAVLAHLREADPDLRVDPGLRETASAFAAPSAFSAPAAASAYAALPPGRRDALTAGLADLAARMTAPRPDHLGPARGHAHERALRALKVTVTLDDMYRALARGDRHAMMLARDAALAETVEWILRREGRIVLAAHNAHVQRCPGSLPGLPPVATMGMHLADGLGKGYLVIGTTSATGQTLNTGPDFYAGRLFTELAAPQAGSLDAVMAASHDGPFATDLRALSREDAGVVLAVSQQRYGSVYADVRPTDAYDVVVHLPRVTPADPDRAALARSPLDVQSVFSQWRPQ